MTEPLDALARDLDKVVGDAHVLTDPSMTASFETDWTGRFHGRAGIVVRPGTPEEVAGVVATCASAGVPIVAQGGNTGLVGAGVPAGPAEGAVVVSLTRLRELGSIDRAARQVTVGAGVTLSVAQRHARTVGLDLTVDFAARDQATVGGAIATNAGGEKVLRHGTMRAQIAGLQAVLADGSTVGRLAGLPKDSAGPDVTGLLVGSEGTIGLVTLARLRLVPYLTQRVVALLAVESTAAALAVLGRVRDRLDILECAELIHADGLAMVCAHAGLAPPFPRSHPTYLLLECADRVDPTPALAEALEDAEEILDVAVGTEPRDRERLWAYREGHTESINAAGVPLKLDVAVPVGELAAFEAEVRSTVAATAPSATTVLFGHLAEGNSHVNILGVADAEHDAVTDAVLKLVAARSGTISAEHGVGRAKAQWLGLSRSTSEIAAIRAVKSAMDPGGLLNPGVLLPR